MRIFVLAGAVATLAMAAVAVVKQIQERPTVLAPRRS
jgi:hypothetical protein